MKLLVTIPTYWCGKTPVVNETVFDHPTVLGTEGTLGRTLESLKILNDKDFEVLLIVAPTHSAIEEQTIRQVASIVAEVSLEQNVYIMTPDTLSDIKHQLYRKQGQYYSKLIGVDGYSKVRNASAIGGTILNADALVYIDDDEVFEDPDFLGKVRENLSNGRKGFAGYYLTPENGYLLEKEQKEWEKVWGKLGCMNQAFRETIGTEPRIKLTNFAFGGNMVLHKDLFAHVPFDPEITRGEDIDYVLNCRMLEHEFYLDNSLRIKHLPPKHSNSEWKQFREDVTRFFYEKEKIKTAGFKGSDFGVYPGTFLTDDLCTRVSKAAKAMAKMYRADGDEDSASSAEYVGAICSLSLHQDYWKQYLQVTKRWKQLHEGLEGIKESVEW